MDDDTLPPILADLALFERELRDLATLVAAVRARALAADDAEDRAPSNVFPWRAAA